MYFYIVGIVLTKWNYTPFWVQASHFSQSSAIAYYIKIYLNLLSNMVKVSLRKRFCNYSVFKSTF